LHDGVLARSVHLIYLGSGNAGLATASFWMIAAAYCS
jgi:hypothetical protein